MNNLVSSSADGDGLNIVFYWIPAHKGIYGNEVVDGLAKYATSLEPSVNYLAPV